MLEERVERSESPARAPFAAPRGLEATVKILEHKVTEPLFGKGESDEPCGIEAPLCLVCLNSVSTMSLCRDTRKRRIRESQVRIGKRQMTKLLRAFFMMGALILLPVWPSSASAQELRAQQALVNLYKAAQQIIKDPGSEYKKGGSPDFPRPSEIQMQWDSSMAAHGNDLTSEERKQFIPCVAHLNAAITDVEIGYRIQISQPNNPPAQESARKRLDEAPPEFAKCASAHELALSEIAKASGKKPQ
jgi:hypothetical protein